MKNLKLHSKNPVTNDRDPVVPAREKRLNEAAIRAIIGDFRLSGDFRRSSMQSFLQVATPDHNGPAARTVRRNLKNLYNEEKKARRQQLSNVQ